MAQSVGAVALDIVVGKNEVTGANGVLSKLGGVAKTAGKAVAVGVGAGSAALVAMGKSAISAYADYEQLTGGVETLFKDMADEVIGNASKAYETAGLSANEYMETVTSFSASLLQSVGGDTVKAAQMADMAITDMSDNANKMGTSMEMIQNAYNGFAKQNYTMLDNLKLGYGGTKEEMARLLADAEKLSGQKFDLSSYADVVDAIHVIQTEMGITGTTAKEASSTISGSIAMTKSAWTNLMTGLADSNANIPALVGNVLSSGTTVLKNIIPVAKQVLESLPEAISEISPKAGQVFQAILDFAKDAFPVVKEVVTETFDAISNAITFAKEHTGLLIGVASAIGGIVTAIGLYNTVTAIKAAMDAAQVTTVWGLVAAHWAQAAAAMAALAPYLLVVAAIGAVIAIIILCIKYWDNIVAAVKTAWEAIASFLAPVATWFNTNIIQPIVSFFKGLWSEITEMAGLAWEAIKAIWDAVAPYFEYIWEWIKTIFSVAWEVIKGYFAVAWEWIKGIWDAAVIYFTLIWENIKVVYSVVKDVLSNYFKMAWENIKIVWDIVVSYFKTIWDSIKLIFSVVKDVFTGNFKGAWEGIKGILSLWGNFFKGVWDGVKQIFANVGSFFKNSFQSAWDGVKKIFGNFKTFFADIWESIKKTFSNVGSAISNAISNTVTTAIRGVLRTATSVINGFISAINLAIGVINAIPGVSIGKISKLNMPQLEYGGVLKKGQVGLLEGKGAEAVVPLERNTGWLTKIATMLNDRLDLGRALEIPALKNVSAGSGGAEQRDGKIDKLLELMERFLASDKSDMTVPIYIGNELIDEYILNKNNRNVLRSGGHA